MCRYAFLQEILIWSFWGAIYVPFFVRLPITNAWYCHSLYTAFSSNVGAWGMWACSLFLSLSDLRPSGNYIQKELRDCHHVQLTVSCIYLQEIWSLGNTYGAWILLIFYSVTLRTPPQLPWRNPGKRRWKGSENPRPMDSYPTGNCCRWSSSVGMIWDKNC